MEYSNIVEWAAYAQLPAHISKELRLAVDLVYMPDRFINEHYSTAQIIEKERRSLRNSFILKAANSLKFNTDEEKIRIIQAADTYMNMIWRTCQYDRTPRDSFNDVQKSIFFAKKIIFNLPGDRQLRRILKLKRFDI